MTIWKSMTQYVTEKNRMILYVTGSMIQYVTGKICMILYVWYYMWLADFWKIGEYDTICRILYTLMTLYPHSSILSEYLTHWIYQNSMLMSWPETTKHTVVLLMTQWFRNDLSFLSRPQNFFSLQWNCHLQAIWWAP